MPQPKIHRDAAERQAAYRQRKRSQRATQAELASLARSLHAVIQTAVMYVDFPLDKDVAAARPEQAISNLIRALDPIYDPVRNPNGTHGRAKWGGREV